MATHKFTVEEILQAAEQSKYPNFNEGFIQKDSRTGKVVYACVIGEAFLNLGMVPNGISPIDLSDALSNIVPDEGSLSLYPSDPYPDTFTNLADFINTVNGYKGYQGKKRIAKLVRKHFSKSLNKTVTIKPHPEGHWGDNGIQFD